jgi:hypothetical protein
MNAGNVIRLVENASRPIEGAHEMCEWAHSWVRAIDNGRAGNPSSIAILVQRDDGSIGLVCQSLARSDKARLIGILTLAISDLINDDSEMLIDEDESS